MSNGNDSTYLHGGGKPGVPSGNGGSEPPANKHDAGSPHSGRVARDDDNLLKIPVTRLRIGWFNGMPSEVTRFRFWVPTKTGGTLTLQGAEGVTVDLRRPFTTVIKPAAKSITYEVKPGEFGEFFTVARGKAEKDVYCTFVQTGFARDGSGDSDPPLIPWNFWYWPSSRGNYYADRAGDVMERYAKAFGIDPGAARNAELGDHGTPPGVDWAGHCHMGAAASAVFEEPQAVTINGQAFTSEEMKYLAAEYFGNFGNTTRAWALEKGPVVDPNLNYYFPFFLKPGEPMNRDTLVDGIEHVYKKVGESIVDPQLVLFAVNSAVQLIANAGGEAAFEKSMQQWMGELAAEFYQALIDHMRVAGEPLEANMRSYTFKGGPEEVWNQVYFWYSAHYMETSAYDRGNDGLEDDTDMIIYCELRANRDYHAFGDLSTGLPATVSGGQVTPTPRLSLFFKNRWRIKFNDDTGEIIAKQATNRWLELKGEDNQSLYAPHKLLPLTKLAPVRLHGDQHDLGNKFIGTDLVKGGWLKVRKRYQ